MLQFQFGLSPTFNKTMRKKVENGDKGDPLDLFKVNYTRNTIIGNYGTLPAPALKVAPCFIALQVIPALDSFLIH